MEEIQGSKYQIPGAEVRDANRSLYMLLLGSTGVGKSTLINALRNNLTFSSLDELPEDVQNLMNSEIMATSTFENPELVKNTRDPDEKGASVTQKCKPIHTPGIWDDQDVKNMKDLMYEELNAASIPNHEGRSTDAPRYSFVQKLHEDACCSIPFCRLTDLRSTFKFYRPAITLLKSRWDGMVELKDIKLDDANTLDHFDVSEVCKFLFCSPTERIIDLIEDNTFGKTLEVARTFSGDEEDTVIYKQGKWSSRNCKSCGSVLLVFGVEMCSAKTGLVKMNFLSKFNCECTEDGTVRLLTPSENFDLESDDKNSVPEFGEKIVLLNSVDVFDFDGLPLEILWHVLLKLQYEKVFQLKTVSRNVRQLAESEQFHGSPSRKNPTLTSCYFFIDSGVWKWAGYDASAKEWRMLPPLTFLPVKPDLDLFKEFLVCSSEGLVCINLSKVPDMEKLIVFNPLSQVWTELPPLNHRRNPVVMHLIVNPISAMEYQVIVAGSSSKNLSQITEVFDSCTWTWTRIGDVLGPPNALNEFQSGVYINKKLFCIGFLEEGGKGIMTYDVEAAKWSSTGMHLLPFFTSSTILQLVENDGELYLFSERMIDVPEATSYYERWIDRVEWNSEGKCELVNVVKTKSTGGKSLEVYPEHVIVPFAEGQLCVMNAITHTGVVYDVRDQEELPLEAPVGKGFRGELGFFSLNPMSFTVEPRFSSKVKQALP